MGHTRKAENSFEIFFVIYKGNEIRSVLFLLSQHIDRLFHFVIIVNFSLAI